MAQLEPVDYVPDFLPAAPDQPLAPEARVTDPSTGQPGVDRVSQILQAVTNYHGEKFAGMIKGIYDTAMFPGRVLFEGYRPSEKEATDAGIGAGLLVASPPLTMRPRAPGAFATGPGVVREAPGYYSAVENAVRNNPQPRASGDQWLATIKNSPGVKAEEMQWLGLDDFAGKPSITKEELLNHVNNHKIQLKEHVNTNKMEDYEETSAFHDLYDDMLDGLMRAKPEHISVEQVGNKYHLKVNGQTYEEFQTRSSANRVAGRTVSLAKDREIATRRGDRVAMDHLEDEFMDMAHRAVYHHPKYKEYIDSLQGGKYEEYTLPGGTNYKEHLLTLPQRPSRSEKMAVSPSDADAGETIESAGRMEDASNYRSAHWDEPNIVVHARTNDRVIDGKKTLFIEEIQSDWHQQGREHGYGKPKDISGYTVREPEEWNKVYPSRAAERADPNNYSSFHTLHDEGGVNVGEFKVGPVTHLEQRHIKGHVEDDPSKHFWDVTKVEHGLVPYGHYPVSEFPTRADAVRAAVDRANAARVAPDAPFKSTQSWSGLAMKQMIRRAAAEGYDQIAWTPGEVQAKRYGGAGGEGNAEFYDKILPSVANKIGNKFDARVGKIDMELKPGWEELLTRQPESREHARKEGNITSVHVMPITDKLKDVALQKGFPLFTGKGHALHPVNHDPFEDDGTMLAPDGHRYMRDPDRPGKYLRVDEDFEARFPRAGENITGNAIADARERLRKSGRAPNDVGVVPAR